VIGFRITSDLSDQNLGVKQALAEVHAAELNLSYITASWSSRKFRSLSPVRSAGRSLKFRTPLHGMDVHHVLVTLTGPCTPEAINFMATHARGLILYASSESG